MMKQAVIISGGKIQSGFALDFLKNVSADLVIGADRGIVFCREHGIRPDYIVGDFDSAERETLDYFLTQGDIPVRRFCPRKDHTDTELALKLALELEAEQITILGGTGSRLDHVAANIRTLALTLKSGTKACLLDENNRIWLTDRPVILEKARQFGTYVSLFAFGKTVTDLTLEGFAYPLVNYRMEQKDPLGVSNEIAEKYGKISFSEGILLVIESKD